MFKGLVPPAVKAEFDLGIRNDLHDEAKDKWQRGWRGIGVHEAEGVLQVN